MGRNNGGSQKRMAFGKDVNQALRDAERLGCTWRRTSHGLIVFGPDGRKLGGAPASHGRQNGALRQLQKHIRRIREEAQIGEPREGTP